MIEEENICPFGSYYAVDDFEDGVVDRTQKWTVSGEIVGPPVVNLIESGGAIHRNGPANVGALPVLSPRSISFAGRWKIYGEYSALDMVSSLGFNPVNYVGLEIDRVGLWRRLFALQMQSATLQRVVIDIGGYGSFPTFSVLVAANIAPGTHVKLSIEYDGTNLLFKYNGAVVRTEAYPSGAPTSAYTLFYQYSIGGSPFTPDVSGWLLHASYFWPYSGTDKQPCLIFPEGASMLPSSSARVSSAQILKGRMDLSTFQRLHNRIQAGVKI